MKGKAILLLGCITLVNAHFSIEVNNPNPALDNELYENVLDDEECRKQVRVIQANTFLELQFIDAGLKIPRGITQGNFLDMGNYKQCLGIRHIEEDVDIQGKYCQIRVPTEQNFKWPWNMKWSGFDPTALVVDEKTLAEVKLSETLRVQSLRALGVWDDSLQRSMPGDTGMSMLFTLSMCIPKPCSTEVAISAFFFNVSAIGFTYNDRFCRLPDDKPWTPADTTATIIFSFIGLLTLLCTTYDLVNKFYFKNDSKPIHPLYTSFSAYTNGRRLMSFTSKPGTLHCLDGIRALAMMWVVVGHTFGSEPNLANSLDAVDWILSKKSLWILAAPITVDTFFCLAGLVLVYSSAGKTTKAQFIRSLPFFYMNRLFRLAPLLATAVLLQASFLHRIFDGPIWTTVINQTNYCRTTWWLTLLHLQNFINRDQMCLPHSWYVAIDFHCYIVSPLVLYWVLGRSRKKAWIALTSGLIVSITVATSYSFVNDFPSWNIQIGHPKALEFPLNYYFNTLTRASPFFVGMLFGYVLHILREVKLKLSWMTVATLWACSATISTTIFFYPSIVIRDWDNQLVDNIMNSFMRPAWSVALCWMIIACVHGYAGPINWFLSLDIWKLPSRISYAIFIIHYPLMFAINSSALTPIYFTVSRFTFKFCAHLLVSFVASFFLTLFIDAPLSTICKQLFQGKKKPEKKDKQNENSTDTGTDRVEVVNIETSNGQTARSIDGNS